MLLLGADTLSIGEKVFELSRATYRLQCQAPDSALRDQWLDVITKVQEKVT